MKSLGTAVNLLWDNLSEAFTPIEQKLAKELAEEVNTYILQIPGITRTKAQGRGLTILQQINSYEETGQISHEDALRTSMRLLDASPELRNDAYRQRLPYTTAVEADQILRREHQDLVRIAFGNS